MAIRKKKIRDNNGISYTYEVDSSLDYSGLTNDTYFKNLDDGLIYWKDLSGRVIGIYELGDGASTTGSTLIGNTIYFDRTDALSAYTTDLSPLITPELYTTGTTVVGATAYFDRTDALSAYTLDLSPFTANTDTNDYTTGTTVIGATAYFDRSDALSAYTLDLSPFTANTDTNDYTTGTTIVGTTAYFDRSDSLSAYTLDLSTIAGGSSDYGNIIFVSEVGPNGQTRNEVIGDILKPVSLEWASQIAQSGDTIHVKAGSYIITTTDQYGLTVNGVNHYFEEGAKVYKSTTGAMFRRDNSFGVITSEGNVYGNGSFYTDGACQYTYLFAGFESTNTGYTGPFSITSVFEFDECVSSGNTSIIQYGAAGSTGDVIIRGKKRIVNTAGNAITVLGGGVADKVTIDCPYISTSNPSSNAIQFGGGGGGGSDLTINSQIIEATGNPSDIALYGLGSTARVTCNAVYVNRVNLGVGSSYRNVTLNVDRIDEAIIDANLININGHVGKVSAALYSELNVKLCDEFDLNATNFNSIANITMSNITGNTNTVSVGTVNLKSVNIINGSGVEHPGTFNFYTTGSKDYSFGSPFSRVNLLGKWDNGDTISVNGSTLLIDSNAEIKDTTFELNTGKAIIKGRTEDCQLNVIATNVVLDGATMIVSDQNKQIVTTPAPVGAAQIKVYSAGLNTNKFGPFSAATEYIKVDVTGLGAQVTINGETFTSAVGATNAAVAQELVGLINGSGTVGVTASQDTPGVDTYFYVESDTAGFGITISYDINTNLNEQIRFNNGGFTDIVGGTVIEDVDID